MIKALLTLFRIKKIVSDNSMGAFVDTCNLELNDSVGQWKATLRIPNPTEEMTVIEGWGGSWWEAVNNFQREYNEHHHGILVLRL